MTSSAISPPAGLRERTRQYTDTKNLGTPPLPRRRSSLLSVESFDDTRQSASNLVFPTLDLAPDGHNEPSHWHSAPLVFAILPALGGLFFTNGSSFVTDILLLGLAAIFLNWSVRLPWDWYHSAQEAREANSRRSSIAVADDYFPPSKDGKNPLKDSVQSEEAQRAQTDKKEEETVEDDDEEERRMAAAQLRIHEIMALTSTFVLPAMGAYLLHVIRGQLSQRSEGLVSDYNLSIFLLAAEIRPVRQLIRLVTHRTLHLQRVVKGSNTAATGARIDNTAVEARLAAIEASLLPLNGKASETSQKEEVTQLSTELRKRYEPRLEALERAVRRYEKRATTLTLLTEQRLQSLETRIQDALSLAAAAAHSSQKPGMVATLLSWISKLLMVPMEAACFFIAWPINIVQSAVQKVAEVMLGPAARPKRRADLQRTSSKGKMKRREDVSTPVGKA
ncbi:hypothetical protein MBLNU457_1683t1 [Dothideomycetes sp. NU457]